jgi:hypothetical protein
LPARSTAWIDQVARARIAGIDTVGQHTSEYSLSFR